ncbi:AMP-binding protein [Paenibacillus qinlingensis]|uniref:Long-subunit acyl-CoA synthetase (AMP-forming) n=1 Tax=Paenibacillus qinlingensis TaxID=1837343 RepID=A0ABU1P1J3_9BACL|nr:AMP-binding protein [Paenibacillus qinlingensis]MDR6553583.1 long-subunit acyl-CoA synthetase (AMP-forming) [Paenibacillus qinlingensis]
MSVFWNLNNQNEQQAVVSTDHNSITYSALQQLVDDFKSNLPSATNKQLGLLLCSNDEVTLVAYLASLQSGHAVMLVDEQLERSLLEKIIDTYKPTWIASTSMVHTFEDYQQSLSFLWVEKHPSQTIDVHPDLAVLLSTSGTTGSAKFVRLSYENLQANALSISKYLQLDATERAITTLPFQYSYGLSVINSHLLVGGALIMTKASVLSKEFWSLFKEQEATSLAGVPYTYQMLHRLRFGSMELPSLRYFTQAGGRLATNLVQSFHEVARETGRRFYVMYGQTEATARMSYVPSELLSEKVDSVGKAIPNGKFQIDEETSELIYEGPNVMLGYAEAPEDLAKGDELKGKLHTGDIADMDDEGFVYIKGRMKRFIKLFGLRMNLDEIEKQLEAAMSVTVACTGNDDKLIILTEDETNIDRIKEFLRNLYKLHASSFSVKAVPMLPRLENGKMNYTKLKEMML